MASPLLSIPHTTHAVKAALRNNCWSVMMNTGDLPHRITNARTVKGQFQVYHLRTGKWLPVLPSARIYQD